MGMRRRRPTSSGSSFDSDAQAFFTATGITDSTIKNAVNQLVLDLKDASIWTKMNALYPFVGGGATEHSYNLKNPATFQITWNGTVTHNANGITGNGSTGYGNTGLNPFTTLTNHNTHLSVYNRSNSTRAEMEIGAAASSFANRCYMFTQYTGGPRAAINMNSGNVAEANPITNGLGFWIGSRTSTTSLNLYQNGSSVANNSTSNSGVNLPSQNIYIGGINSNGSPIERSSKNIAFASIGAGLNGTEAANFTTAVETFQDALSRGVV